MAQYLDLRGHQTYCYEWENNGEAVVMLHGGLSQTSHWDYVLTPDLEPIFTYLPTIALDMVTPAIAKDLSTSIIK